MVCDLIHFPREYLSVNRFHGGGTALGQAISDLDGPLRGFCICDRDQAVSPPPFRQGTTGASALNALLQKGVLENAGHTITYRSPFFRFLGTFGWSLENYIGPNVLSYFFSENKNSAADLPIFVSAFPQFPDVSDDEMELWKIIHFKSELQKIDDIHLALTQMHLDQNRAAYLARLKMPTNALVWVRDNFEGSRFSKHIQEAFKRDLRSSIYRHGLMELAEALPIFIADTRIALA